MDDCRSRWVLRYEYDLVSGIQVKKFVFAWELRNQFTHGNYRCLSITEETGSESTEMRVRFSQNTL